MILTVTVLSTPCFAGMEFVEASKQYMAEKREASKDPIKQIETEMNHAERLLKIGIDYKNPNVMNVEENRGGSYMAPADRAAKIIETLRKKDAGR